MSKLPASPYRGADKHVIVVRRPRMSDGVGSALRDAFARSDPGAPAEWALLIERIDRVR